MNSAATDTLFRVVWFITDLSGGHIPRSEIVEPEGRYPCSASPVQPGNSATSSLPPQ